MFVVVILYVVVCFLLALCMYAGVFVCGRVLVYVLVLCACMCVYVASQDLVNLYNIEGIFLTTLYGDGGGYSGLKPDYDLAKGRLVE